MANDLSIVLKGTLTTTPSALQSAGSSYTVPAGRKLIIMEMSIVNSTTTDTVTNISMDGTSIFPLKTVPAKDGFLQQRQSQLLAGKQITGYAGANSAIDYYLSCLEVDA